MILHPKQPSNCDVLDWQQYLRMRLVNQQGLYEKDASLFGKYKQLIFYGHKRLPTAMMWSPQGSLLATAENYLRIWHFHPERGLDKNFEVKGNDIIIDELHFLNENSMLSMSKDIIKFWDVRSNFIKQNMAMKASKQSFAGLTLQHSPDSHQYTVLLKDNKESILNSYDIRNVGNTSQFLHSIKPSLNIQSMQWDRTDSVLFCGGVENASGMLYLYNSALEAIPESFALHTGKINSIALDPQNNYLATCSDDSLIQVHELPEIICCQNYTQTDQSYRKLAFNCNGNYLAVSSDEKNIEIYNVAKAELGYRIKECQVHDNLCWHPRHNILAYVNQDDKRRGNSETYFSLFAPHADM